MRFGQLRVVSLDSRFIDFPSSDSNDLIDRCHENLAVTDLAGSRASDDGVQDVFHLAFVSQDGKQQFGMEVDLVLGSPVKLGVPLLPTETNDLGEGKAFDADVGKALPHLLKTSLSNYGIDPFHCGSSLAKIADPEP